MSTLEDLVRRTLASHELPAPDTARLMARVAREPARRHRARSLALGAAVAVVAVVAGATALVDRDRTSSPTPRPVTSPPPVPAGMRAIGYRGVEMFVPLDFQESSGCSSPRHDAYRLEHGTRLLCDPAMPHQLTFVTISTGDPDAQTVAALATESTTVDGALAHRGTIPAGPGMPATSVLYVNDRQLLIGVQAPTREEREALLRTVHLLDVDRNGCAVHAPDLGPPTTSRDGSTLIPGAPTSVAICYYNESWIRSSATVTGTRMTSLITALNDLPAEVGHDGNHNPPDPNCGSAPGKGFLLHSRYAKRTLDLAAHLEVCSGDYVGDRHGTSRLDQASTQQLVGLTGYDPVISAGGSPG